MIVAMVSETDHHMNKEDLGGLCWSDGVWENRVYSWRHKSVIGLHPCHGWYQRKDLQQRKVV